jgi:hypothetical protein
MYWELGRKIVEEEQQGNSLNPTGKFLSSSKPTRRK